MEALKKLFKAKAEFVRSSEEEGNAPSPEQLGSFLRNLTQATGLAIRGAPPAVRLERDNIDASRRGKKRAVFFFPLR